MRNVNKNIVLDVNEYINFNGETIKKEGTDFRVSTTVSGVDPTQDYHLTTKQYVDDEITTATGSLTTDHGSLTGLEDDDHLQYLLRTDFTTYSGAIINQIPTDFYSRAQVDTISGSLQSGIDSNTALITTTSGGLQNQIDGLTVDHGALTGLEDDDHPQYILVDGSRGFTATVSGIDPTESYHLSTKNYVDNADTTLSGVLQAAIDGKSSTLLELTDTPSAYDVGKILTSTASGTEWSTISGASTQYVDDLVATTSGIIVAQIITDHGGLGGLTDDDHTQYILSNGTRDINTATDFIIKYSSTQALKVDSGGVTLQYGTNIREFSTDNTLGGNSTTAVPTEYAVKYYVDAHNWLEADITDLGSYIESLVEDTTPQLGGDLDLNSHAIDFPSTANIADCLDEDDMASDSATSLATQQSIKAYTDAQIATISGTVSANTSTVVSGSQTGFVEFTTPLDNNDYIPVATIYNNTDTTTLYPMITETTTSGFYYRLNAAASTANYQIYWHIADYTPTSSGTPPEPPVGDRGVTIGGYTSVAVNTIDYITISSVGNASDFGDMGVGSNNEEAACSNGVNDRGVYQNSDAGNELEYITISTAGNGTDFGNLTTWRTHAASTSNNTNNRGVFTAGLLTGTYYNIIDYITISSAGNATDFGDIGVARFRLGATSNGTNDRGVMMGGENASPVVNIMDYITIPTTGNASDFGDLTRNKSGVACTSNLTNERAIAAGAWTGAVYNDIDYVTVNSASNAADFGDLLTALGMASGNSNGTNERGVVSGAYSGGSQSNVIQYVTISSTGNSTDFGDLTLARRLTSNTDNA